MTFLNILGNLGAEVQSKSKNHCFGWGPKSSNILFLSNFSSFIQAGIGRFMLRVSCLIFYALMFKSFSGGTHSSVGKT